MKPPHFKIAVPVLFFVVSLFFMRHTAFSADDSLPARDLLFKTVDQLMKTAKEKQADIYAPKAFKQALKNYNKAEDGYQKNKPESEVEKYIQPASENFQKAIDAAEAASVVFNKTILSRHDAIQANGRAFDPENWDKAEKKLASAAELLEGGHTNGSKKKAKDAEDLYRKVELKGIQGKLLKETWTLLQRTKNVGVKKYAPITLKKAEALAAKSASLLELHRYDQKDAAQLAKQAEYEAGHSIYLSRKIKRLKKNDRPFEILLLDTEKHLQRIAINLDAPEEFNKGIDIPVNHIVAGITALKDENTRLAGVLKSERSELLTITDKKNYEIVGLREQNHLLEEQLNRLASTREKLELKVMEQKKYDEKIARINALFSTTEGRTFIEGKNVIIRLFGLNFPSGKSIIPPRYFPLLSKLKSAFSEFPNSMITIEGHTDAVGSKEINQRLSNARAQAVRQYIIANSNISWDRINAVGFGESRPVASNETVAGQKKNRRIDVLIQN